MNRRELNGVFNSLSPTGAQKEKMLSEILKGEVHMKKSKNTMARVLIAAVIAAVAGTSALAATFGWHEKLAALLKPTEAQMEQLQGAVNLPMASVTDGGATVNVLQTLTDRQGIYVLYEFIAPEGTVLNDELRFELESFIADTDESAETSGTMMLGTGGSDVLEVSGNKMTVLHYMNTTGSVIKSQEVSLYLENLGYFDESAEDIRFVPVVSGVWEVRWHLDYVDTTRKIEVHQPLHVNGANKNEVTAVYISPISVQIYVTGDDVMMALRPVIRYRDGRTLQLDVKNDGRTSYMFANHADGDGGVTTIGYRFHEITDPDTIESITIGDVVVPVAE